MTFAPEDLEDKYCFAPCPPKLCNCGRGEAYGNNDDAPKKYINNSFWAVLDNENLPIFLTTHRSMANDHINVALNDDELFEQAKNWHLQELIPPYIKDIV